MISTQVLATKLYPPPPRSSLVSRPRLVERLNTGLRAGCHLVLVSAAAGFGKTTLAGEWIEGAQLQHWAAWVSLDDEDNNPTRFLFYVIAALQQVNPEIGKNLLPIFQSPQPPPLTELADQLINQIAELEHPVLLVLDDYHLITADTVHQIALRMIERQPGNMHTVLLSREDPPFPLPRMRVRSQLVEIRERDLRLNLTEAQAFLTGAMGLSLSPDDVGKLKEHTEGWIAGMQLAALALEEYSDDASRRSFIDTFTGSDRYIVDYLVSEVLDNQPETVRDFLLRTSVMDQFCSDLCDQVLYPGTIGAASSQNILESLEQANMFLVPLDNQRQWYRYHHLFGEMLRHYLNRSFPDRVPELNRRASEWYQGQEKISEAVKYALLTGDWDFAGALIGRYAMRLLLHGQDNLVIRWCQSFPKSYLTRSPEICIYYAWALALTFRYDYLNAVEEKLLWAEQALESPDLPSYIAVGQDNVLVPMRDWVTGQICVVRSQILLGHFHFYVDPQELIALSLKGLELVPEAEKGIRATCKVNLAHAQLMQNDLEAAQDAFEKALPFMLEAENTLGGVTCIFYQARLAYYMGAFDRAEFLCRHWKEKFQEMASTYTNEILAVRGLDIVMSILLLERGSVDEAEVLLNHAVELSGWGSWMEVLGFIALARLHNLKGDHAKATETLSRMANLGPQHVSCAEALQILFALGASPDAPQLRAKAETWARTVTPNTDAPLALGIGPYHCDVEYFLNLTWAQVQLTIGYPNEALKFIMPALESAKKCGLNYRILELTLTRAAAYDSLGDFSSALSDLESAFKIAERYGYHRVFHEGLHLQRLLQKAASQTPNNTFLQTLLISTASKPVGPNAAAHLHPATPDQTSLIEPLSARELEVLQLISGGFSNEQIASQLYIAQGTVKRHITNLYGKLAVQSRTQAIAKARADGLLK